MDSTPVIDMFSGTGQLARAVSASLVEPTRPVSFSDTYRPARKYLRKRFSNARIVRDFRHRVVPEGSIVTIGAPRKDLSAAGEDVAPGREAGPRSSLTHDALDMAAVGGADLIIANLSRTAVNDMKGNPR